jgi:hypothetical protein
MAEDRHEGDGDKMPKDDRREGYPIPHLVPTHVLTEREALANYGTIANSYNHFIEYMLPGIETKVDSIKVILDSKIDDFTGILRVIRDENRTNVETMRSIIRSGMANIAKDVMAETRKQMQRELSSAIASATSNPPKPSAVLGLGEGFDPELTPHGGVRMDSVQLAALQERLDKADRDIELKKAEARGAEMALDTVRDNTDKAKKRFLFWLKIAGGVFPILIVILTFLAHILHVWDAIDIPKSTPALRLDK